MNEVFLGTVPSKVSRNSLTGVCDLEVAKAAHIWYNMAWRTQIGIGLNQDVLGKWHDKLTEKVGDFSRHAEHINVAIIDSFWTLKLSSLI